MTPNEKAEGADFDCSLCRLNKINPKNVQLQADYILLSLLSDRDLDPIQRFCSEVSIDKGIMGKHSVSAIFGHNFNLQKTKPKSDDYGALF